MNRQQRREEARRTKKYEGRQSFSKKELEHYNKVAYDVGVNFTLQAAKEVLGLGEVRLKRLTDRLTEIEAKEFGEAVERAGSGGRT